MQPAGGGFKFKLKVKGAGGDGPPGPAPGALPGAYPQQQAYAQQLQAPQQLGYGAAPQGYGAPDVGLKRPREQDFSPAITGALQQQPKRPHTGDGAYGGPAAPPLPAFASHGGGVPLPSPSAAGLARPTVKVKLRTASSALGSTPSLDPGGSSLYGRPPAGPSRPPGFPSAQVAIGAPQHYAPAPADLYQQQQQHVQQHYAPYGQQQRAPGAAPGAWGASPFAAESRMLGGPSRKDVEREQKAREREQARVEREEQKRREKEEAAERKRQLDVKDQLAAVMGAAFGVGLNKQASQKVKLKIKGAGPSTAGSMGPPTVRMPSLTPGAFATAQQHQQQHQQPPSSAMQHQQHHDAQNGAGAGGGGAFAPTPSSGSVPRSSTSIRIKVGGLGGAARPPSGALPTPGAAPPPGMLMGPDGTIPMQPMMPYTGAQQQQQQQQQFADAAATLNSILRGASGPSAPETDAAAAAALDGILQRQPTRPVKVKAKIKASSAAAALPSAGAGPPSKRLKHQQQQVAEGPPSGSGTPTAAARALAQQGEGAKKAGAGTPPGGAAAGGAPRSAKLDRLWALLEKVLDGVAKKDEGQNNVFKQPVTDDVAPGYSKVVKEPMCFDTMREKLRAGRYLNWDQFEYDMALVFDNAQAYNPHGSFVHHHAAYLRDVAAKYAAEAKKGNTNFRGVAAGITRRYMAIWSKEHPNTIPPTAASHAAAKAAAAAGIDLTADGLKGPGAALAVKERHGATAGVIGSSQAYGRGHRQHANVSYAVDLDEQRPSGRQGGRGGRGRRGGAHGSAHSHAAMRAAQRAGDPDARRMNAVYVRRAEAEDLRDTFTIPANHTILPVANWRGLAGGANVEGTEFGSGPFALRCLWPGAVPAPTAAPGSAGAPDRSNFNGSGLPLDAYTRSVARFVRGWHPALRRAVLADRVVPCLAVEGAQLPPAGAPASGGGAAGGGGAGGGGGGQPAAPAPQQPPQQQQGSGHAPAGGGGARSTPFGMVASLPAVGQAARPVAAQQPQIQPAAQGGAAQAQAQGAAAPAQQQQQQATPPPQQPLTTQETIVVDDDDGSPLPDLPPATP